MANLVTLSRLLLVFAVVVIAYQRPLGWLQLANVPLLVLAFAGDGLDGWLARRRGEASRFGALFDIAADRIAELTLWVVLADLDLIPVWVPLVFIGRGVLVDTLRTSDAAARGKDNFSRQCIGINMITKRTNQIDFVSNGFCRNQIRPGAAPLIDDRRLPCAGIIFGQGKRPPEEGDCRS